LLTGNHFIFLDVELLNAVRIRDPCVIIFLTVMALCNTVMPIKRQVLFGKLHICIFVYLNNVKFCLCNANISVPFNE
jgi:hypothetical protein